MTTPPLETPAVRRVAALALVALAVVAGSVWRGGPAASGPVWSVIRFAVAATLVLAAVQLAWRRVVPSLAGLRQWSILALILPLGIVTFLVPPFEVPDEEVHWMLALKYFRPDVAGEPSAYRLSEEIFGSSRLHFQPDQKFETSRLDVERSELSRMPDADLDAKHQWWRKNYPYAMPFAYPVEAAIFALFPRIETVRQAELLFYFCRLVSAGLLLAILWALNRRFQLPFTALFFFSLPLVLQQSAAVSSDVLLTVGTLVLLWLFLTASGPAGPWRLGVMWLLGLAIVTMKVMLAGVLLLPLALTLKDRVRRPLRWAVAGVGLGMLLAYPAFQLVLHQVRAYGDVQAIGPIVSQQIASLGTVDGIRSLFTVYGVTLAYAAKLSSWAGPLGWVDTVLDPAQIPLLWWSFALAVTLDLIAYAPPTAAIARTPGGVDGRARAAAWVAAAIAASVLFVTFTDVLIYFLISTPGDLGVRVQIRHFFPIAAMALILPVAVLPKPVEDTRGIAIPTAAIVFLTVLLLARTTILAMDLLVRYW